jgi:uncharacterized protein YdeI (YjbR/CyaY-like superfamily)
MGKRHPGIDAYIAKSPEFARPILEHLRKLVHTGCPDVEEALKWSSPHFDYQGNLCGMAAFKHHCVFGFWKASLLEDENGRPIKADRTAMGQYGRIASIEDLPSDRVMVSLVRQAAKLNERGVKLARKTKARPALRAPADLMTALRKNKRALTTYQGFAPSHKREYVEWIVEAKSDETRKRRLATAVEWIAAGKTHNWKYQKTKRAPAGARS